jgi:NAD(P)-dependent dehydrogenase (short-subunit alcohol dehydrogenase family)
MQESLSDVKVSLLLYLTQRAAKAILAAMDFTDKTILVVGGTSGVGAALAEELVGRAARVQVWSRHPGADTAQIKHAQVDVTQPLGDVELPDALHGLAYCPGSITLGAVNRLTDEQYLQDYTVNILGAARTVRHCLPALIKAGGASIVFFSTVATRVGLAYHTSIAAAKAGLEGYALSLAAEVAGKDVRVNVIAPSVTDTPLAASLLAGERGERSAKRHPLARVGSPADMAHAALYLLGQESSWMTGQVIPVDGGLSSIRML